MPQLFTALRDLWVSIIPWTNPTLSGVLVFSGAWLGSDFTEIKELLANDASSVLDVFNQFPSTYVTLTIVLLSALTGYQHHQVMQALKRNATDAEDTIRILEIESANDRQKITEAEETIESLRADLERTLWDNTSEYLRRVVRNIDFSAQERISVYAHVEGWFILAGRFSPNPLHNDPRRRRFPSNEGCIGKAWNSAETCHGTLPDPNKNLDHYYKMSNRKFGLPKAVGEGIRMKSRQYYARAIQSRNTGTRVGVVVLESLSNSFFDAGELDCLMSLKEEHLAYLVQKSASVSVFQENCGEQGCTS